MSNRILCVDDEPNILLAFERQLRRFDIKTAIGGEAGLETLESGGPFAVVMSDLRMPGMSGVQFLAKVKERCPTTVRIMLTGQADLFDASQAVNEGNIFRFLLKPCPSEVLSQALDAALAQFRLVNAERDLLEQTLRQSIEVLSEVLSIVNPEAFGRAYRMRRYVRQMTKELQLPDEWQYEIAAMLSQIGSIAVPPEVLGKMQSGEPLSEEERKTYNSQYQVAYDLLARIPRLDVIARMVQGQSEAASLSQETTDTAALGSRMLKVAQRFDDLIVEGKPIDAALARMRASRSCDMLLLDAMANIIEGREATEISSVRIARLRPGMILNADVRSRSGLFLLGKGQEITPSVIARLQAFSNGSSGVIEPLSVVVRRRTVGV